MSDGYSVRLGIRVDLSHLRVLLAGLDLSEISRIYSRDVLSELYTRVHSPYLREK
jgi:hypothetical protein